MKQYDLFVVGCGRSGTSMVAGVFRNAGYFMGERLIPPRDSNPLGFFEDVEVNAINDALLRPLLPERFVHEGIVYAKDVPARGHLWLARLAPHVTPHAAATEQQRIRTLVQRSPFCFKDPRFCYTAPLWRQEAPHARFLCVFRDPRAVVTSIFKEVQTMPYLADLAISVSEVFELWRLLYRRVLDQHCGNGEWLFLSYEDLFRPDVLDRLEDFSGVAIDRTFPRWELRHSPTTLPMDDATRKIYQTLLEHAARYR